MIHLGVLLSAELPVGFDVAAAVAELDASGEALVLVVAAGPVVVPPAGVPLLQNRVVSPPVPGWRPLPLLVVFAVAAVLLFLRAALCRVAGGEEDPLLGQVFGIQAGFAHLPIFCIG